MYCSGLSNHNEKSLSLTFSSLVSTGDTFGFGPPRFHLQQIKTQHNDIAITGPMMAAKIQYGGSDDAGTGEETTGVGLLLIYEYQNNSKTGAILHYAFKRQRSY